MKDLTPSQIERWADGQWIRGSQPKHIAEFQMDAREIQPDDVFIALRTGKRDGHEFVSQAADSKASFAIVEHPQMYTQLAQLQVSDTLEALHRIAAGIRAEYRNPLIAITGSCGKTSTKDLLSLLLGENTLSTRDNLNNYLGLPLTLTRLDNDEHKAAVVEVGISMKGEMKPLAEIARPDYAIVTCVAPAHLEGLGSIEGVAAEKAGLLSVLKREKTAFFPADCLKWAPFRELCSQCVVTAGEDEGMPELPAPNYSLVRYQAIHTADSRTEMLVFLPGRETCLSFNLPHLSTGMQSNAALALVTALEMGVTEESLNERLIDWKPGRMRGEVRVIGKVSYYVDCYNANPASMMDAVHNFRETFPKMPRLFLMGCMNELGEKTNEIHRELGEKVGVIGEESFCIFGTQCESLREGLAKAGTDETRLVAAKSRAEVRTMLEKFQRRGGAVFIKGSRSYKMEEFLPEQADVRRESR